MQVKNRIVEEKSENEEQERKINNANAKITFSPKFIPFYLKLLDHGFNHIDCLVFGFIDFYTSFEDDKPFYFSNSQLATMLQCSEKTISRSINKIKKHKLIKIGRKIKHGSGQIRRVRLDTSGPLDWTFLSSQNGQKGETNNNNKTNNNINTSDRETFGVKEMKDVENNKHLWQEKKGGHNDMLESKNSAMTELKFVATHEQIVKIFDIFAVVNPGISRLYGSKSQRTAISDLIAKYGFEEIQYYANIATIFNNKPYAPVITTPLQLLNKIAALISFINRERGGKNNILVG